MRLSLRQPQDYFSYCLVFKSMPMVAVPAQASSLKRATKILQLLSSSMKRWCDVKAAFLKWFPLRLELRATLRKKKRKWRQWRSPTLQVMPQLSCVDIRGSFSRRMNGDSEGLFFWWSHRDVPFSSYNYSALFYDALARCSFLFDLFLWLGYVHNDWIKCTRSSPTRSALALELAPLFPPSSSAEQHQLDFF